MAFAQSSGLSDWQLKFTASSPGRGDWIDSSWAPIFGSASQRTSGQSMAQVKVYLNSQEVPVCAGRIRFGRNQPADWSVTIDNSSGDYSARGGTYSSNLRGDPSDRWQIEITRGNDTWLSPELIQETYSVSALDRNPVVSGKDLSLLLNKPAQGMSDIRATANTCITATQAIIETLGAYGLSVGLLEIPDRVLDTFHRVGNPMEWVRGMLFPFADWRINGELFDAFEPGYSDEPVFHFEERLDIEVLDYEMSPWDIRNSVTVEKVEPGGGCLAELEASGGGSLTEHTVEFSEPVASIQPRVIYVRRGYITLMQYLDEADNVLTNHHPTLPGAPYPFRVTGLTGPAKKVRFTYTAAPGAGANGEYNPGFHIKFCGSVYRQGNECFGDYNPDYEVTVTVPTAVGVQAFDAPYSSQSIPTRDWAIIAANLLAQEGAHRGESLTFQTQLFPHAARPSQRIEVSERRVTGIDRETFFLEAAEHAWDHRIDPTTKKIRDTGTSTWESSGVLT